MKKTKLITILLLMTILFSACTPFDTRIDVKELGTDFCKEQGFENLTDYKGSLDPKSFGLNIFTMDNKHYIQSNIKLECDNNKIFSNIVYFDPNRQDYKMTSWGPYLSKSSKKNCVEYDKWGDCIKEEEVYLGKAKFLNNDKWQILI